MALMFDPFKLDNQEEDYTSSTVTDEETLPFVEDRGFLMDTASSLGRGVLDLAHKGSKAAEVITGLELPFDEWADEARNNFDFFKPDITEYLDDSGVIKNGWMSAMQSLVPSLGAAAPGAAAGAVIGGSAGLGIGAVPGAIVGGILSTLGLFGAGTYGEAKQEALEKGMSEEAAHSYALKMGAIEGGIEATASGVEAATAGLGKFFTRPVTTTLKQLLKTSPKEVAKAYLKTAGVETGTEMLQSGLGAAVDLEAGMSEKPVIEAMAESIIPSLFMSGIFVAGAQGFNARQKAQIARDLQSSDKVAQARGAEALYQNLLKQDPAIAASWKDYSIKTIDQGAPFSLNKNFIDMFSEVQANTQIKDIDPLTSDIDSLTEIVNMKLNRSSAVPYAEAELNDEFAQFFENVSLRYNRIKNAKKGAPDLTAEYGNILDEYQRSQQEKKVAPAGQTEISSISDAEATAFEKTALEQNKRRLNIEVPGELDLTEEYRKLSPEQVAEKSIEDISRDNRLSPRDSLQVKLAARMQALENQTAARETKRSTMQRDALFAKAAGQKEAVRTEAETKRLAEREALRSKMQAQRAKYEKIVPAREALETEKARGRVADAIAKDYGLSEEQRDLVKTGLDKEVYGVPLDANEQSLLDEIRGQGEAIEEQPVPQATPESIEAPSTQISTPEQQPTEVVTQPTEVVTQPTEVVTQPTITRAEATMEDIGAVGYEEGGQAVPVSRSPEDILIARESSQVEQDYEVTPEGIAKVKATLSPEAQLLTSGDTKSIKAYFLKRYRDAKSSGSKGQGLASMFDEVANSVEQELATVGLEYELNTVRDELKSAVTHSASSRRESKFTKDIPWDKTSGTMWTAQTPSGYSFIADTENGTLSYRKGNGEWQTVEAKGKASLLSKAAKISAGEEVLSDTVTPESVPEFDRTNGHTRETDADTLLREIRKDGSKQDRIVAALLLKFGNKDNLKKMAIVPAVPGSQRASEYSLTQHAVFYNPRSSDRSFLHEIVHGLTANTMRSLPEDHPLLKSLDSVMMAYNKWLGDSKRTDYQQYTLSNPFEFLSMSATEAVIQEDLRSIPVPKSEQTSTIKTLWDKLIDTIRKAFNLPTKYHSALEEVLRITSELGAIGEIQYRESNNPVVNEYIAMGYSPYEARQMAERLSDFSASSLEDMKKTQKWIERTREEEVTGFSKVYQGLSKAIKGIDKFIEPVSRVVEKISPVIHQKLNEMEVAINLKNQEYYKSISGFVEKFKNLSQKDQDLLSVYLANSNDPAKSKVLNELLDSFGMSQDWKGVQSVLSDIYNRYEQVGLNTFKRIDKYFPRKVKDPKGLLAYLRTLNDQNAPGGTGMFDEILEDTKLSEKEKEDLIASAINRGFNPATALKIPSSAKSRSIHTVTPAMMRFYSNPVDALVDTIYQSNEAIETRKFVGVTSRKKLTDQLNRLYEKYNEKKDPKLLDQIESVKAKIQDVEAISDSSISAFIQANGKKLSPDQQTELTNALRARLNQKGMHGSVAKLRDVGLITALGSPLNAITQIGDIVWSLYENGPTNTIKAIFGPKEITPKDLDMSHVLKEFAQGSTAKWVDRALHYTGFNFMDQFGKTVNMQAAINRARDMSQKDFVSKWSAILTEERASKVWSDIQSGKVTDDVKHFAFSSVAKFQPVSLSEMPQMYLQSGNGRIFYTLKSYGIKTLSNLRREIVGNFQAGNKAEAVKGLGILVPLLVLANASTDEIKDFILGRDDSFSDTVWDNLLKLGFSSRYMLDKGFKEGLVSTFFKSVLTPPGLTVGEPFLQDIYKMVSSKGEEVSYKSLSQIPLFGKIAYAWSPEGREKEQSNKKADIYAAIRESVSSGSYSEVRRMVNEYNRKNKGDTIDNKTIRSIKAKERKRLRGG